MAGLYVPLVMIPRFTSYLGAGEYTTEPLDVSAYAKARLTVWRGPLIGSASPVATLDFLFEQADDPDVWLPFAGVAPIVDDDDETEVELPFVMRWLRLKLTLDGDNVNVAALTAWVMGHLERRENG